MQTVTALSLATFWLSSQLQPVSACAVQTHLLRQARGLSKARAPSVFRNKEKSLWARALDAWVPTRYVVCSWPEGSAVYVKTTATASMAKVMMQQKADEDHFDWKREQDWWTPGYTPCWWRPPQNDETQALNSPNSDASGNSFTATSGDTQKVTCKISSDTSGVFASHLSLSLSLSLSLPPLIPLSLSSSPPPPSCLFLPLSGSFSLPRHLPPPPNLSRLSVCLSPPPPFISEWLSGCISIEMRRL